MPEATQTVRCMDDIGAQDITVGQVWMRQVCPERDRQLYRVVGVVRNDATVILEPHGHDGGEDPEVSFGSFLTDYTLWEEAPTRLVSRFAGG